MFPEHKIALSFSSSTVRNLDVQSIMDTSISPKHLTSFREFIAGPIVFRMAEAGYRAAPVRLVRLEVIGFRYTMKILARSVRELS